MSRGLRGESLMGDLAGRLPPPESSKEAPMDTSRFAAS